jgi:hypothetical protein
MIMPPIVERYRPASVSEGNLFMDVYCDNCHRFVDCNIIVQSLCKTISDADYPVQLRIFDAHPYCTDFIQRSPA